MPLTETARTCHAIARQVRAMPSAIVSAVQDHGTDVLAAPVAARLRGAYVGPWARPLAEATTVRPVDGVPAVVVGGAVPLVSGGATGRQLLPALFGASGRVAQVTRRTRGGGSATYPLRTGRQFAGRARDTITPAIAAAGDQLADAALSLLDPILREVTDA